MRSVRPAKASQSKLKPKPKPKSARKKSGTLKTGASNPGYWLEAVPKRSKEVLSRKNFDGTVSVMHLANDDYIMSIHGVAAEVWMMIDGRTPLRKIHGKIVGKYKAPEAKVSRDLQGFVKQLQKEKLIESLAT